MISRIRRRTMAALIVLGLTLGIPLGVTIASHQFADVPDSNVFHDDIDAIADANITFGCGGGNFCPTDFVTREHMAAFLNRLGSLDGSSVPSVNAKTAETAGTADTVDGIDSTGFIQGSGSTANFAFGDGGQVVRTTGAGLLTVNCDGTYNVQYTNHIDGTTADLWIEKSAAGTTAYVAVAGISVNNVIIGGSGDEHVTLRARVGSATVTWDVWLSTTGGCHVNGAETTGELS